MAEGSTMEKRGPKFSLLAWIEIDIMETYGPREAYSCKSVLI